MILYNGSPDKIVTHTFGRVEERHDYAYLSNLIFKQIIHYDFTLDSARM